MYCVRCARKMKGETVEETVKHVNECVGSRRHPTLAEYWCRTCGQVNILRNFKSNYSLCKKEIKPQQEKPTVIFLNISDLLLKIDLWCRKFKKEKRKHVSKRKYTYIFFKEITTITIFTIAAKFIQRKP